MRQSASGKRAYTLACVKQIASGKLYNTELNQVLWTNLEGGREVPETGTYAYLRLIHAMYGRNQHNTAAIILQFKFFFKAEAQSWVVSQFVCCIFLFLNSALVMIGIC